MGCVCSKAAPEDEERTVHEEYPARLYLGLQVQVSAAQAGRPALQDWHVHGEATYLFAALCATSERKACSRKAHEVAALACAYDSYAVHRMLHAGDWK
jgi:hypothetical protein